MKLIKMATERIGHLLLPRQVGGNMSSDLSSVKSSESSGIPQIALEPSLQPLSYSTLPDAGHEKVKMKDEKAGSEESAKSNTAAASIPTEPIKRVRRKRDPVQSDSTASSTTPVKKTRKARVLSSTVRTTNSSTTIPSKVRGGAPTSTRQLEITDLVPSAAAAASSLLPTATSQNGKIEAIPKSAAFGPRSQETASANITTNPSENKTNATITSISHNSPNTMATHDQMPIYVSSGQKYDPVRAASNDNQRIPPTYTSTSHSTPQSPSMIRSPNRASASPAISSLIDPPSHSYNYSANHSTHTSPTIPFRLPTSAPTRPNPPSKPPSPLLPAAITTTTLTKDINTTPASPSAMSIDASPSSPPPPPGSAPPSTRSPTKSTVPTKRKASLPPLLALPQLPGTGATTPTSATNTAPTVVLHIPLTGASNQYVNFARLAEAAYGFAALHPRLAAQRERLARVAAAGAALEASARAAGKDEGEDLDGEECSGGEDGVVDGMDGSGDVGGGGDGAETANGGGDDDSKPRKKRKTKEETYDKDDPFVDDTELAWEEQAAASKDGFFVYSGPLVPVGETASVERAAPPRRSRATAKSRATATRARAAPSTTTTPNAAVTASSVPATNGSATDEKGGGTATTATATAAIAVLPTSGRGSRGGVGSRSGQAKATANRKARPTKKVAVGGEKGEKSDKVEKGEKGEKTEKAAAVVDGSGGDPMDVEPSTEMAAGSAGEVLVD